MAACTDRFKSDGVPVLRGRSGQGLSPLTKMLSATDGHQQREVVFANGVSLGILSTLQCRPWCTWSTQNRLNGIFANLFCFDFFSLHLTGLSLVSFDGAGHSDIDL